MYRVQQIGQTDAHTAVAAEAVSAPTPFALPLARVVRLERGAHQDGLVLFPAVEHLWLERRILLAVVLLGWLMPVRRSVHVADVGDVDDWGRVEVVHK